GSSSTSTYRSPAGPPPGPTSPWPDNLIRIPSPTPAGILAVTSRRTRTLPSPLHCLQGWVITSPKPWHTGHGRAVTTWPRNERCTDWISPCPSQVSHVLVVAPSAVPAPRQRSHRIAVSTVISLSIPVAHSSRLSESRISASEP